MPVGIVSRHVDHRMVFFPPGDATAFPMTRRPVPSGIHKSLVLGVGHRRPGDPERVQIQGRVVVAVQEASGRDLDQLDTDLLPDGGLFLLLLRTPGLFGLSLPALDLGQLRLGFLGSPPPARQLLLQRGYVGPGSLQLVTGLGQGRLVPPGLVGQLG